MLPNMIFLVAFFAVLQPLTNAQYTFDCCRNNDECAGARQCMYTDGITQSPCTPEFKECLCFLPEGLTTCNFDDECLEGDVCTTVFDDGFCITKNGGQECVSPGPGSGNGGRPTVTPKPSESSRPSRTPKPSEEANKPNRPKPSEEANKPNRPKPSEQANKPNRPKPQNSATPSDEGMGSDPTPEPATSPSPEPVDAICVAAEELEGVEKVFDRDFHAWVLCDAVGSCATPGHMVVWKGAGMMMKSYCAAVGCERKVMAVNSPRWKSGAVKAKTDGLAYTSLAARFETSVEEAVLAAVVKIAV